MSSLHREVMRVLMGDITAGAVGEGERLPSLTELAAQFEVSTGVVRECQRALQERGLVSVHHGRRAVVRPEEDWDVFDPDVLAALMGGRPGARVLGRVPRVAPDPRGRGRRPRGGARRAGRRAAALERIRGHARGRPARSGEPGRGAALREGGRGLPQGHHPRRGQPRPGAHGRADPSRADRHVRGAGAAADPLRPRPARARAHPGRDHRRRRRGRARSHADAPGHRRGLPARAATAAARNGA